MIKIIRWQPLEILEGFNNENCQQYGYQFLQRKGIYDPVINIGRPGNEFSQYFDMIVCVWEMN